MKKIITLIAILVAITYSELSGVPEYSFCEFDYMGDLMYQELYPERGFLEFKENLGYRESTCDYKKINSIGFIGKYQFGSPALSDIGVYDKSKFLNSPTLQENAFLAYCMVNKFRLRKVIPTQDTTINGIFIDESAMIAAAHLLGAESVKNYIRGLPGRTEDDYGTTIEEYLIQFCGYDLSDIKECRKVNVYSYFTIDSIG